MRTLSRILHLAVMAATLAGSLSMTACFPPEYRDPYGHPYRHARWHDEHVYLREDGRWHARRNGAWVPVEGVEIDERHR